MEKIEKYIHDTFLNAWDGFWVIWLSQLLWLIFSIPIITMPLAFAGMYSSVHAVAMGESTTWKTFFEGIKSHFKLAVRWSLINLIVIGVLAFYIWFFSSNPYAFPRDLSNAIEVLAVTILAMWLLTNQFTFPFMLVQEKPSMLQALRNSLVMFLKWPAMTFGFTVLILCSFVLAFAFRFFWVIFSASMPAFLACSCVKYAMEEALST